ncbi:hypothetical protein [Peptoniphilus harei]|uniref:Uncharacterized protein n=1 Tax=Peptoniphilus harei TaxID=54005 RepID=A0A943XUE1_9FIRM|nr:hypothetical protein [Peptoniphilus harei]MBS6535859.1 hypothetical protein [Peptoniphilus harei]
MGHCTDYIVVDKKKDIMGVAQDFAFYNTNRRENPSGSYNNVLDILEGTVYEDFDSANLKASELETIRGSYNDFAIPFYSSVKQEPTKQMKNLIRRLEKITVDKCEYDEKHSIKNLSSKLITCKHCESKLAKDFLKRNNCPVCGKDLRSQYILDRIKKYDEDYKKVNKQLVEISKKRNKKGPIKWLVKVEVHC